LSVEKNLPFHVYKIFLIEKKLQERLAQGKNAIFPNPNLYIYVVLEGIKKMVYPYFIERKKSPKL